MMNQRLNKMWLFNLDQVKKDHVRVHYDNHGILLRCAENDVCVGYG